MFLRRKTAIILLSVGAVLLTVGIIVTSCFPSLYKAMLRKELSLLSGTIGFEMWRDLPLPIYQNLYFFNITNPDEFLHGQAKPNLMEVGPYAYRSKWQKKDIGWFNNGTVSFREVRTYHFLPEKSAGSEDDIIFTLNGPMIIGASMIKEYGIFAEIAGSILFGVTGEEIIIKRSINQLAYGGYEDIIIKLSNFLKPDIPFKNGIFSWFSGKNATDDGLFTVFTGEKDLKNLNVIERWNGNNRLAYWSGEYCNMMNGTNGEMGPPIADDQQTYEVFQSFLCRSWSLKYAGEVTNMGILSKRFVTTASIFGNETVNPDNFCFETQMKLPSGGLDLGKCEFDAPMVMTFPHFYLADPSYLEAVDGLHPNPEDHGTLLDVQPLTGVSVNGAIRIQFNLQLEKIRGIVQFQKIPELVFPVFWLEIDVTITEDLAKMLRDKTERPKVIFYSVFGVLTLIGLILVILGGVSLLLMRRHGEKKVNSKEDDDDPLLNPAGSDEVPKDDGNKEEQSSQNPTLLIKQEEADVSLIDEQNSEPPISSLNAERNRETNGPTL